MLRRTLVSMACFLALFVCMASAEDQPSAAPPPRRLPGVQPEGEVLLPNQWSLRPAGKQLKLGDLPVQIALHPNERWAAVLHAGYGEHEIVLVDLEKQRIVS